MSLRKQIFFTCLAMVAVLVFFELTNVDIWVNKLFYDPTLTDLRPTERWFISKEDPFWEKWLHRDIKNVIVAIEIIVGVLFFVSFFAKKLAPYRRQFLFFALAPSLLALSASVIKQKTHTYCPNQTIEFGAEMPYKKLLDHYPHDFKPAKKGKCFPASHATVGFGLLALYFVFTTRRAKRLGLATGMFLGWGLGFFQMLRGEHFLSHNFMSMLLGWLICLLLQAAFDRWYPKDKKAAT